MKPETTTHTVLPPSSKPVETEGRSLTPPPAPPAMDADLALRTVMLLQSLVERVMGDRSASQEKRRSARARRSYTPRSEVPLSSLGTPPMLPTLVRRRSLQFSCPCCGRATLIVRRQAGSKIRCPHCLSALVAPNPRRRLSAHSLERDITTVLHPESFAEAERPSMPRWVRVFVKEPVLILALAALVPFSALMMLQFPRVMDRAKGEVPTTVAQADVPKPRVPGPADGSAERAESLVQQFLAAESVAAKAALVRDSQRVAPLMAALAQRAPEEFKVLPVSTVKAAGLSHYQDPQNPVPVTPVVACLADGTTRTFFVEHTNQGDVIEWESSIGYSEPLEIAARTRRRSTTPARALWRVEAAPDDYFNRGFADEDKLICLRLTRADAPDETYWAYAPKDSEVGQSLRRIWNEAPRSFTQRLTVLVEGDPSITKTHQVRLAEVKHAGWRTPSAGTTLVAGNP